MMKESVEERPPTTEEETSPSKPEDAQNTPVQIRKPSKTRRFVFFLKHIVRFFAIIGCFTGCCYFLIISANRLSSDTILQEFKGTSSVGDENLQITVCPVAPFEQVLALNFKVHTRRANNLRELDTSLLNRPYFSKGLKKALKCLYRSQYVHMDAEFSEKLKALYRYPNCMKHTASLFTNDFRRDALEIYTWIRAFLTLYMLNLHKEGDVDFYQGIYKSIDILKQDNATLPEFLKSSARDLEDFIISDFEEIEDVNLNQPTQKVVSKSLSTRFGPRCTSYTLSGSEDGNSKLNQRYQLQLTFNRVELAYMLVFVNENRTFSDIPGASVMEPYRVPLDSSTLLHIRQIEKTVKNEKLEGCKTYDKRSSPGSHVECMEACLLRKLVMNENITCLMPWMKRNSTSDLTDKPFCKTYEEYLNTRLVTQQVFRGNISDCNNVCTESCEKLNILVKIMGTVTPTVFENDQRLSVILMVSNEMGEFSNRQAYGWGEFTSEVFGSLSFILGIAFVALIDWIFATLLWLCGKLPYIPAMPPLINRDLYLRDIYYHIRHELYGDPIPMTISQRYLRAHEKRRDAFHAAPALPKKTVSDPKHPQFPRLHQRKSSLTMMSETLAVVSQHQEEALLHEQLKSLTSVISRHGDSLEGIKLPKGLSYPLDASSRLTLSPSKAAPPKTTSFSVHDVPTKRSEPKITVSAPDEEPEREKQTEQRVEKIVVDTEVAKEETQQATLATDKSALPGIDQKRRVSRAASVLRDLDVAETSHAEGVGREQPTRAISKDKRRSSAYRTKPRRKSYAVAPAPVPEVPRDSEEEPPD